MPELLNQIQYLESVINNMILNGQFGERLDELCVELQDLYTQYKASMN